MKTRAMLLAVGVTMLGLLACDDDETANGGGDNNGNGNGEIPSPDGSGGNSGSTGTPTRFKTVYYGGRLGAFRVDVDTGETTQISERSGNDGFFNPFFVSPGETYFGDKNKVLDIATDTIAFSPSAPMASTQLFLSDTRLLYLVFGERNFHIASLPDGAETVLELPYDYCFAGPDSLSKSKTHLAIACQKNIVLWNVDTGEQSSATIDDDDFRVQPAAWLDEEHFAYAIDETVYVQHRSLSKPVAHESGDRVGGVIRGGPEKAWFAAETRGTGGARVTTWYSIDKDGNVSEIPWLTEAGVLPERVVVSGDGSQVLVGSGKLYLYAADGTDKREIASASDFAVPR